MERIAAGYALAEAPVSNPAVGVWFSDVIRGGVYHWSRDTGMVETVVARRKGVGGMARHHDGGIVISGKDIVHVHAGKNTTLYSDDTVAGFNDLAVDKEGRLVVGVLRYRPFENEEMVPGEYVRIEYGEVTSTLMERIEWVNGCGFSPDGKTFYGCDYRRGLVLATDIQEDGTTGWSRVVVQSPSGEADGMVVDEQGGIWVALGARASVGRFRPDTGELDLELKVPAQFVSSLCFSGPDRRDMFITTGGNPLDPATAGGLYMTRIDTPGLPAPAVV